MKRYIILAIALGLGTLGGCSDSDSMDSSESSAQEMKDTRSASAGSPALSDGGEEVEEGPASAAADKEASSRSTDDAKVEANDAPSMAGSADDNAGMQMAAETSTDGAAATPMDIVDTAVAAGSFTQLADALTKANLVDALKGEGPFTVFAPTDAAFDALEQAKPGTLAGLSVDQLGAVLKYHVVSGAAVKSEDLKSGQLVKTLGGPVVAIDLSGDKPTVNGVTISMTDIMASNGIIHVIDAVLLPPGDIVEVATEAGTFTKLAEALKAADLVGALQGEGPFTVFAPTDAAFAKLSAAPTGDALRNVLLYHVLDGTVGPTDLKDGGAAMTLAGSPVLFSLKDGAKINDAMITTTNVVAKNGVIHVIDSVIVPPADDIVATAVAAGSFTKLAEALASADLVSALQGEGPFTVFAPTDEAFAKLMAVPSGDALKDVLLYHVVDGAIGSGDLVSGDVPTLLTDKSLTIDVMDGVKVNDATVTQANILTKNGIIHVIDSVLVPN